ncbi:hypothetical protein JHK84_050684 [Glycine max]|nr:hypothetical protein JHK84_050684 [Glycine max]
MTGVVASPRRVHESENESVRVRTRALEMSESEKESVRVRDGSNVVLSSEELKAIKNTHGFVVAYLDRNVTIDTTDTSEFLSLDSSSGLWHASNFREDVIVGVIDIGVWPKSEGFKDHGMTKKIPNKWKGSCKEVWDFNTSMCNFKLIGARYFNKGVIEANSKVKINMNSARDTLGHGTHTSLILAANYVNFALGEI